MAGRSSNGFTLIETSVVLFLTMLVLFKFAYPNYRAYVIDGHRGKARAAVLAIANKEKAYMLDGGTYAVSVGDDQLNMTGDGWTCPRGPSCENEDFVVTVAANSAKNSFLVTADPKPTGNNAGSGSFSINQNGEMNGEWNFKLNGSE